MGPDYHHSAVAVDYRQDSRTDSTAEEQLEAFNFQHATTLGPVDAVWADRRNVP